jgi:hypothetical protein
LSLKIDLHVHTYYSHDSTITPKQLVIGAKKRGLDAVAVTDHDKFESALRLSRDKSFLIIPGIEVSTRYGHVLGLGIGEGIPPKLDVKTTIDKIHEAGGIAIAAHPTSINRGELRKHVTKDFDAVEVINAASFPFRFSCYMSRKIAEGLNLPQTAGTDAHTVYEIGTAYSLVDASLQEDEIISAIKKSRVKACGKAIPLFVRLRRGIRF